MASRIAVEELARLAGRELTPAGAATRCSLLVRAQARLRAYVERHSEDSRIWYAGTTVVVAVLVSGADGPAGCSPTSVTRGRTPSSPPVPGRSPPTTRWSRSSWPAAS
ncbi:hypothetical protein [Nocardioides daphniae]|uniref:Uncharacterized protein n=1 Tax=Nocardioides daphniae TaxID=402297 RepID=A0A4P7UCR7_9ACTN|nr:hypothetical protein [Nocardioides daphniae]QCC78032.1 hypothetical protein E2C04_14095 [Nocardioides daphniae]